MKNLYFDEAGFTGSDLLSQQQPFFCLASVLFTDEELDDIKKDIGLSKFDNELHFKKLHTNWQGREVLTKLFNHPLLNEDHIITGIALKKYCIYAQIVDVLIETYLYKRGLNLYKKKGNIFLANSLYYFAFCHNNQTLIREFEETFVNMVRCQDENSCSSFYQKLEELIKDKGTCSRFKVLLGLIHSSKEALDDALVSDTPFYLDNTTSIFFAIIQKWYERTKQTLDVLFDNSKAIQSNLKLLEALRDIEENKTIVGYDSRKHVLPFPVGTIKLVDSKSYFGVQVADTIASAFVFILTNTNKKFEKYKEELKHLTIFQKTEISLLPSKIEKEDRETNIEDSHDPLDYICKHVKLD